jgi:hypothetical protein
MNQQHLFATTLVVTTPIAMYIMYKIALVVAIIESVGWSMSTLPEVGEWVAIYSGSGGAIAGRFVEAYTVPHTNATNLVVEAMSGRQYHGLRAIWSSPWTGARSYHTDQDNRPPNYTNKDTHYTMYADLTIIVDGALDSEETYSDDLLLWHAIEYHKDDAKSHGYPTAIYVQYHEHEQGPDCECSQYEQSHQPLWSNEDENE